MTKQIIYDKIPTTKQQGVKMERIKIVQADGSIVSKINGVPQDAGIELHVLLNDLFINGWKIVAMSTCYLMRNELVRTTVILQS